jgi:hypothetical protein
MNDTGYNETQNYRNETEEQDQFESINNCH